MFSLGNFLNKQVIKSQKAEMNKRINKVAKSLTLELSSIWGNKIKEIRAQEVSDSDISDRLQNLMNQILTQMLKLDPDDSDVKEVSNRIIQLTNEHKEKSVKPLFNSLSVMHFRTQL